MTSTPQSRPRQPWQIEGEELLPLTVQHEIDDVMRHFGEIPDRTSPEDFPEGYVLTRAEIVGGILRVLAAVPIASEMRTTDKNTTTEGANQQQDQVNSSTDKGETPRSDEAGRRYGPISGGVWNLCRQLERELAAMTDQMLTWRRQALEVAKASTSSAERPTVRRWSMWVGGDGLNPKVDPAGAYCLWSDVEPLIASATVSGEKP